MTGKTSDRITRMRATLAHLYGQENTARILQRLIDIIGSARGATQPGLSVSERDAILITYGDQVRRPGDAPLATLHMFLKQVAGDALNSVHILPFFPYSSDDGFAIIDYYAVDPALGSWDDVRAMGGDFRLMFDAVFNHISSQSAWFQAFLRGESPYDRYFITVDPASDLSSVVRPRALPLLTRFATMDGDRYLWTTFSEDQIDLNLANPDVLLELIRVLLFYVDHGAALIRLDAIAFLWKTIGTSCIHLEETHLIIRLMRDVLDTVAPHVILITETNVPHEENISYFGDGHNEAQMVYNFALPPLILHTLRTGSTEAISRWAASLKRVSDRTTFFNFTASHDGIGMRPAAGILPAEDIDALIQLATEHGGYVSYKSNSDGTRSPYELNIAYFDAITHPDLTATQPETAAKRFIVSQAIMLALVGVPGIYFHSLFGSRNYNQGVQETGRYRTINREKLNADRLQAELADLHSIRYAVYSRYRRLLQVRAAEPAFHPLGEQSVLDVHQSVFALERRGLEGTGRVLALHNVLGETVDVTLNATGSWHDLIGGVDQTASGGSLHVRLAPYQVAWLKEL